MTLPLAKAVNSLFEKCGSIGIYKGREVLFLLSEPDEVVGIGFVKAQSSTAVMKLRVSEAPDIQVGDFIETENVAYKVIAEPRHDIHALIWSIALAIADN